MGKRREPIDPASVPRAAAYRLSLYVRHLEEVQARGGRKISSQELGRALGLTAAQVRRDLGYFGHFGSPGIGYEVARLIPEIREILGSDRLWKVALLGVGRLGGALMEYKGFEKKGFRISALFDKDPAKTGRIHPMGTIHPMDRLAQVVRVEKIRLAIIAVPALEAQSVADLAVAAGVEGIFNFAPTALTLPAHVAYVSIDLAMQLEQLSYLVTLEQAGQRTGRRRSSGGSEPSLLL